MEKTRLKNLRKRTFEAPFLVALRRHRRRATLRLMEAATDVAHDEAVGVVGSSSGRHFVVVDKMVQRVADPEILG